MARALALVVARTHPLPLQQWLRVAIVGGCAMALILAERPLPGV